MRGEQVVVKASQALDSTHEMMKEAGSSSLTRRSTMMHSWHGLQNVEGLRGRSGSLEWPQRRGKPPGGEGLDGPPYENYRS